MQLELSKTNQTDSSNPIQAIVVHRNLDVVEAVRQACRASGRISVVSDCLNALELADAIKRHRPDVIFVGLSTPGITDLQSQLRKKHIPTFAIDDRGRDGMKFCDIDHILDCGGFATEHVDDVADELERSGGRSEGRTLDSLVELVVGRRPVGKKSNIAFKVGRDLVVLPVSEILWLEKEGNGSRVHTESNCYIAKTSITEFSRKPQLRRFSFISLRIIVNLRHVREIRSCNGAFEMTLSNGTKLDGVRNYRKLQKLLEAYWRGKFDPSPITSQSADREHSSNVRSSLRTVNSPTPD